MTEFSSCPKCGYETTDAGGFCPHCGGRMLTSSKVRKLGWVALVAGIFLVVLMTLIMFWEMSPDVHWEGTAELWRFAMTVESLVIALGIVGTATGVWQIKNGKRNKTLTYITFGLAGVLVALTLGHQLIS